MRAPMRPVLCSILLCVFCGCDRTPSHHRAPPAPTRQRVVEVQALTPLPPGRRTHIAPDGLGRIFWVQEFDPALDPKTTPNQVVFVLPESGLPQSTRLSSAAVLEALGHRPASGQPRAVGSIQSLAIGADRRIYFYFSGGRGKLLLAALGSFDPSTGEIRIHADAARLEQVWALPALTLARGTLLRSGKLIWLWLRHTDGFALLSLETARATGPELRNRFDRIIPTAAGAPDLTTVREDLFAAASGEALLFWDRREALAAEDPQVQTAVALRIWEIQPNGAASILRVVPEVPPRTPAPAFNEAGQLSLLIPAARDDLERGSRPLSGPDAPAAIEYPAVVVLGSGKPLILAKDRFEAPPRIHLEDLSPVGLWRDRSGYVTYDTVTGELLRLRIVEK